MFSNTILFPSWQRLITFPGVRPSLVRNSNLLKNASRNIRSTPKQNNPNVAQEKGIIPAPFANFPTNTGSVPPSNIGKAIIFGCTFSAGCFVGATIFEYESVRSKILKQIERSKQTFKWSSRSEHKSGQEWHITKEVKSWWNLLSPGEKAFAPLCVLNLIVFGLWRVPRLQRTMMTYFCSNPASRVVCWPMFLSTFSHYSTFHIFANMYVLHSFSQAAVMSLGKEQFLGLYLSAGVISSLASYLLKATTRTAGMSLGASGAIMTILAYVCTQYPDTRLGILFIPTFTFSAGVAIKVIMGIDLAGCILGWKFFDHAAHLGGALFGVFWAYVGKDVIWPKREVIIRAYHSYRSHDTKK